MESEKPRQLIIERPIIDENGETTVYLSIIEYDNAIQAAIYDKHPKLGSMTLAFPVGGSVERETIFRGKHEQLSAALALLLVRNTDQIVYASVNLNEYAKVSNELLRDMISEYIDSFK